MEEGTVKGTGYPPGISTLDICNNIRETDELIRGLDLRIARARKTMGEVPPNSKEYSRARSHLTTLQETRLLNFRILKKMGSCPLPGCNKHITIEDESETDTESGTDEDRLSMERKSERASTPLATNEKMDVDFQTVSPRKAARRPSPAKNLPPVTTANRFEKLERVKTVFFKEVFPCFIQEIKVKKKKIKVNF
ncbi:hypothetical protein AVEN_186840-1 [Araneus ventricosus]|uniref:Uncharacterized protein n=1 Tax=Araneus ventricosus TaxID=182803 RepID=A0A4Y2IK22_ARAVE|nr:hypothetical protein AVEN_186840-1 [Araneus ventricosus]